MRLKLQHLAIGLLAMLPMLSWAQSENEEPQQKPIQLTFQGAGDMETVESVTVENLSRGTSITLNGNEILVLDPNPTGIEETEAGFGDTEPLLYPNPAEGDGNLVFDVQQDGEVAVRIFSMDGVLMESANVPVFEGRNALSIPSQGYGFFMVSVEGNGIHFSQKWMCGAPNSGNGIRHNGTSDVELPREAIAMTRAQAPESKVFEYVTGDLLRFTATTGNMKTIVMQKPEIDHTITFQLYKCEDADGYNYPIIEVGGMLWMAEDLRPVKKAGISIMKDETFWSDPNANPIRMAYADYNSANVEKGAYYTPKAAIQALPKGWKLPTVDELLTINKALGGADKAGNLLKAHGEDAGWNTPSYEMDEIQLQLTGNGSLNSDGKFIGKGSIAYILTRSYRNGVPNVMIIQDNKANADISRETVAKLGEGFTIRGVRPAMSAYNGFISNWLSKNPDKAPKLIKGKDLYNGLQGNPFAYTAPLGYRYSMSSDREYFSTGKSIYKLNKVYYGGAERSDGHNEIADFSKDNPYQNIHRLVAQQRTNGLSRLVRLTWSNKSENSNRKLHGYDNSMLGQGTIKMEVFGDSTEQDFYHQNVLDYGFSLSKPKYFPDTIASYREMDNSIEYNSNYANMQEQYMASMKAICADFNGDGIDDILAGISGKIVIIDGSDYKTVLVEKSFPDSGNGYSLVGCSVGDINKDGIIDLAVVYEKGDNVFMEAWWNGYQKFNGPSNIQRRIGKAQICLGVLIGDMNMDGNMDIMCQTFSTSRMTLTIFTYNRELDRLDDLDGIELYTNEYNELNNSEMALAYLDGIINKPTLVADGCFIKFTQKGKLTGESRTGARVISKRMRINTGMYCVGNFDFNQNGKESVAFVMMKSYDYVSNYASKESVHCCLRVDDGETTDGLKNTAAYYGSLGELPLIEKYRLPESTDEPNLIIDNYAFAALCINHYSHPLRELELTSIETTMTEPRIYALLAAPPYWKEYKDKYVDAPGTSWGYENSKGEGVTKSSSHTAVMIAGYEQEFNLPIVATKVGGVDFEVNIQNTWTQTGEKSTQTTYGIDYTTYYQDAVVLTLTPYTAYNYTVIKSGDKEELGNNLMIGAPDVPRNMAVTLSDYMKLRADNAAIPNLKLLFKHTEGNPWSYKESHIYGLPLKSAGAIMWGDNDKNKMTDVGSGISTSRTITITQEQVTTRENEFDIETTLVANTMGIKAGGGYGYNNKNAVSHSESTGHTVSGTVVGPDTMEDEDSKNFRWNFCRANVVFQGQNFPVVTYIVQQ